MSPSKMTVVHRVLDFLAHYQSLASANVLSMGGRGEEVAICQARGVDLANISIVEREPRIMSRLIQAYGAASLFQGHLRTFPGSFRAQHGKDGGLDLWHLDLCGTIEPQVAELVPVLPLLAHGQGHCFALTVADERRNRTLETPDKILQLAEQTFGRSWGPLWRNLLQLHEHYLAIWPESEALSENVALRELGALLYVVLALGSVRPSGKIHADDTSIILPQGQKIPQCLQGYTLVPDKIERFVFRSDDAWRMRTYVFHFSVLAEPIPAKSAWRKFAQLLTSAHCAFIADGGETIEGQLKTQATTPIPAPSPVQPQETMMETANSNANNASVVDSVALAGIEERMEKRFAADTFGPQVCDEIRWLIKSLKEVQAADKPDVNVLVATKVAEVLASNTRLTRNRVLNEVITQLKSMRDGVPAPAAATEPVRSSGEQVPSTTAQAQPVPTAPTVPSLIPPPLPSAPPSVASSVVASASVAAGTVPTAASIPPVAPAAIAATAAPTTRRSSTPEDTRVSVSQPPGERRFNSDEEVRINDLFRVEYLFASQEGAAPELMEDLLRRMAVVDPESVTTNRLAGFKAQAKGDKQKHFLARVILGTPKGEERHSIIKRLAHATKMSIQEVKDRASSSAYWKRATSKKRAKRSGGQSAAETRAAE